MYMLKRSPALYWVLFGEVAACKIAHSQKLTKYVTEQEVDDAFRNEEALTISLMGLIAEDSLINQRLAKLGRQRVASGPSHGGQFGRDGSRLDPLRRSYMTTAPPEAVRFNSRK